MAGFERRAARVVALEPHTNRGPLSAVQRAFPLGCKRRSR